MALFVSGQTPPPFLPKAVVVSSTCVNKRARLAAIVGRRMMARHEGCRASYARSWPGAHATARAIGATTSPVCPPRAGHGRLAETGSSTWRRRGRHDRPRELTCSPPCFLCTVAALEIRRRARRGRRDGVASACRAAPRFSLPLPRPVACFHGSGSTNR
jgi:hypothetical protein